MGEICERDQERRLALDDTQAAHELGLGRLRFIRLWLPGPTRIDDQLLDLWLKRLSPSGGKQAGVEFKIGPQGVRDFEELMRVCRDLGVPVLLVYSPVYYEMQELETNRDQIFERFKEIAQRYDAQLWDYRRSPISFRKDYFVNSEHLNADGAAVFSAEFGAKLAGSGLMKERDTR